MFLVVYSPRAIFLSTYFLPFQKPVILLCWVLLIIDLLVFTCMITYRMEYRQLGYGSESRHVCLNDWLDINSTVMTSVAHLGLCSMTHRGAEDSRGDHPVSGRNIQVGGAQSAVHLSSYS